MTLFEKVCFHVLLFCARQLGYLYMDVKLDKNQKGVEAITISNNEAYIEKVSEIELD